jgi:DNA polymerase III delta prime subunit
VNVEIEYPEQWAGFQQSFTSQRLAHAFILVGDPNGDAGAFVQAILQCLFDATPGSEVDRRLQERLHQDVVWIEPASKSRLIVVDQIRDLNHRIGQTASEGAWKVGVILYAECMNTQAANALLKTLEEPAGQTLLLLVTHAPLRLLPTIQSRCQRIVLSQEEEIYVSDEYREQTLAVLRQFGGDDPMRAFSGAEIFKELFAKIRKEIEKTEPVPTDANKLEKEIVEARIRSRLKSVQTQILQLCLHWQRDLLYCTYGAADTALRLPGEAETLRGQAARLTPAIALRRVDIMEEAMRRLNRAMPPQLVFDAAFIGQLGIDKASREHVANR